MKAVHKLINKCEVQRKDLKNKKRILSKKARQHNKEIVKMTKKVDYNLQANEFDIYTGFVQGPP
jgi:hypothetical protein